MAFRSAIEGLDKVIRSDILPPKVILVTGPPGSMKTSFCYTLMSRYLKDTGEFGLYTTLEETVQSHLRNMESLGVELSMNMQISDFTDLREIDAVGRSSDGEARDRGSERRADRPRTDLRDGREFMRHVCTPTPGRLGAMHRHRRAP